MYEASKRFSVLYSQGVWRGGETLRPEDSVASIFKTRDVKYWFYRSCGMFSSFNRKASWEDGESWKLGYEIISFMRDRMDKATEEHQLNFSVIATPAEGLSGSL